MTTWNYRVCTTPYVDGGDVSYEIVEVYYGNDGKIEGWSEGACGYGDTLEDLRSDLLLMLEALDRPAVTRHGSTLVEVPK